MFFIAIVITVVQNNRITRVCIREYISLVMHVHYNRQIRTHDWLVILAVVYVLFFSGECVSAFSMKFYFCTKLYL